MKKEKLIDSVSELDGVLIEEYCEIKEKLQKKNRKMNIRFLPIAAALCCALILFGSLFGMRYLERPGDKILSDLYGEPGQIVDSAKYEMYAAYIYGVGHNLIGEYGSLTYKGYSPGKMNFTLILDENIPDFGLRITAVGEEDIFWAVQSNMPYLLTKEEKAGTVYAVLSDIPNIYLVIYINGKEHENLPNDPGVYEITVDYSAFEAYCAQKGAELNGICSIANFGAFILGDCLQVEGMPKPPESYEAETVTNVEVVTSNESYIE